MFNPVCFVITRIRRAQFGSRLIVLGEEVSYQGTDRHKATLVYAREHATKGTYDRVLLRVIGLPHDDDLPDFIAPHVEEAVLCVE